MSAHAWCEAVRNGHRVKLALPAQVWAEVEAAIRARRKWRVVIRSAPCGLGCHCDAELRVEVGGLHKRRR